MSFRRITGGVLSAAGVVLAALYAAPEPPHWSAFAASLGVLILGLLLLRQRSSERRGSAAAGLADLHQWAQRLQAAAARLEKLVAAQLDAESADEVDQLRLEVFVPFA